MEALYWPDSAPVLDVAFTAWTRPGGVTLVADADVDGHPAANVLGAAVARFAPGDPGPIAVSIRDGRIQYRRTFQVIEILLRLHDECEIPPLWPLETRARAVWRAAR